MHSCKNANAALPTAKRLQLRLAPRDLFRDIRFPTSPLGTADTTTGAPRARDHDSLFVINRRMQFG